MIANTAILDGNEAAASIAYRLNEVIAIYPSLRLRRWGSGRTRGRKNGPRTYGASIDGHRDAK